MFLIWSKLKVWEQTKVSHSKQPLTRENAYSLSTLGKVGTYNDILEDHRHRVLEVIKAEAKLGNNYLLWTKLSELAPSQREELAEYLLELNYQILYKDDRVLLISWLWDRNSFENRNDR